MKALNSNKKNIIIIISIAVLTIVLEFAMISRVTINLKGKFNIHYIVKSQIIMTIWLIFVEDIC